MAINTQIVITDSTTTVGDVTSRFSKAGSDKQQTNLIVNYLMSLLTRARNGKYTLQFQNGNAASSTGTLTLTSVVATNTCSINGITFTAIASGATGNQFNVGGTDTITATNLAAVISASVTAGVTGIVVATSALGVVTVSAALAGAHGNGYTITGSTNIVASGARLTGGVVDTATITTVHHGL
jgi:hypothetical protein